MAELIQTFVEFLAESERSFQNETAVFYEAIKNLWPDHLKVGKEMAVFADWLEDIGQHASAAYFRTEGGPTKNNPLPRVFYLQTVDEVKLPNRHNSSSLHGGEYIVDSMDSVSWAEAVQVMKNFEGRLVPRIFQSEVRINGQFREEDGAQVRRNLVIYGKGRRALPWLVPNLLVDLSSL